MLSASSWITSKPACFSSSASFLHTDGSCSRALRTLHTINRGFGVKEGGLVIDANESTCYCHRKKSELVLTILNKFLSLRILGDKIPTLHQLNVSARLQYPIDLAYHLRPLRLQECYTISRREKRQRVVHYLFFLVKFTDGKNRHSPISIFLI